MNLTAVPVRFLADGIERKGEPVTRGIPFPKGLLRQPHHLICKNPSGKIVPLQVRGLEQWSDGSWKWVLCDWRVDVTDSATYLVEIVNQPCLHTCVSPTPAYQINDKFPDGKPTLIDEHGNDLELSYESENVVEEAGELRISLKKTGYFSRFGKRVARLIQRTSYFPKLNIARVQITLHNFRKAIHPGGLWDLGDGGSLHFKSFGISYAIGDEDHISGNLSAEIGIPFQPFVSPLELYQDSSGGENWRSTNHINKDRRIPLLFQGYRLRNGKKESYGKRATPIVTAEGSKQKISVSVPQFWQNFPKSIELHAGNLNVALFPTLSEGSHEIQGGEQKTHVYYLAYGSDGISTDALAWTRKSLVGIIDPSWIEKTFAISYLTAPGEDEEAYQSLVNSAIEGNDTFESKREVIDEYGWRHFGDIYGDHEAILHTEFGPKPRISHYNNQYDPIAGFTYQWLRTGDRRWYAMMDELAFHVRDIDLYNTDEDKSAYNHGLFWHTYHYVDADTGTHRSYPKNGSVPPTQKPVPGGGPGSEQNYAHGLLLHYFLTGDFSSKEACIGMAQWVVDMDDGSKTVFRHLSKSDTGVASASRSPDYQGPGRGSGNSLATLLDGYRLTGDRVFLKKAEVIIRRVIHPRDDIQRLIGMTLGGKDYVDAENRWFYVMFLQSLGKYLDIKFEKNELDENYAYAQASLLHYARWMLDNEYPYLDRPEILEYPTETWVAQDIRKCEVFQFAALHAKDAEREAFIKKAEEYFAYVTKTLPEMPTKTLCRPVVILLGYGWSRFWHRRNPSVNRPAPKVAIEKFPPKPVFVPQKAIAMKRAKRIIASGLVIGFIGVIGLGILIYRSM